MTDKLKCPSCPNSYLSLLDRTDIPEDQKALREGTVKVYICKNCNILYSLKSDVEDNNNLQKA